MQGTEEGGQRERDTRKGNEEELSASPLSSVRSSPWPLPSGCEQEKAPYLARNRRPERGTWCREEGKEGKGMCSEVPARLQANVHNRVVCAQEFAARDQTRRLIR